MKRNISSKLELITPAKARSFLQKNTSNRVLRSATVRQYAQEIRDKQWIPTHQGIAFDPRGNLIDGQHRLNAIIEAGIPVNMMVSRNVEGYEKLDCGLKRTMKDRTGLDSRDVSIINLLHLLNSGSTRITRTPATSTQVKVLYEKIEDLLDTLWEHGSKSCARGLSSAAVHVPLVILMHKYPKSAITIAEAYKNFVQREYTSMKNSHAALLRSIDKNEHYKAISRDDFYSMAHFSTRVYKTFTPGNEDLTQVRAAEREVNSFLDDLKNLMKGV